MRTAMALLFKFVATFIASWVAFGVMDVNTITMILTVAVAGTVLNYALGDLVILPSMGNIIASVGDGILAGAVAYLVDLFSYNFSTTSTTLIIFAVIVAAAEYFFHLYLLKDDKVAPNEFHREPPME